MDWKSKPIPDDWKPTAEERAEAEKEMVAAIEMVTSPDWKKQRAMFEFLFSEGPTQPQPGSTQPDYLKPGWVPPENWEPTETEARLFMRQVMEANAPPGTSLEDLRLTFEIAKELERQGKVPELLAMMEQFEKADKRK